MSKQLPPTPHVQNAKKFHALHSPPRMLNTVGLGNISDHLPGVTAHIAKFLSNDDILRVTSVNKSLRDASRVHLDKKGPGPIGPLNRNVRPVPRRTGKGTLRQKATLSKIRNKYAADSLDVTRMTNMRSARAAVSAGRNLQRQGIEPFPEGMPAFHRSVRQGTRRY